MNHSDPQLEPPRRPSLVGRWILWVPAVAVAFYLGSVSRQPITDTLSDLPNLLSHSETAAAARPATAGDEARMPLSNVDLARSEVAVVDLFKTASPSVVYITTVEPRRVGYTRMVTEAETGTGSGFVWDDDGHIVTNFHVIRSVWNFDSGRMMRGDRVRVTLADQSEWDAEVLGVAPEKDLAVLKVAAPKGELLPLQRGVSSNLLVGQSVYAIGNPFGLDQTLTTGIVSALDREIRSIDRSRIIRNVVQTDAAINPGNSGGPLLDSRGRLIGVNTQIASTSGSSAGIGFAIPVDTVKWVVPDLLEWGEIARPTLGLGEINEQYLRRRGKKGVLVVEVTKGSGASRAGVHGTVLDSRGYVRELGDIIIGADGQEVSTFDDLLRSLENREEGEVVGLRVLRGDEEVDVPVELGPSNAKRKRRSQR